MDFNIMLTLTHRVHLEQTDYGYNLMRKLIDKLKEFCYRKYGFQIAIKSFHKATLCGPNTYEINYSAQMVRPFAGQIIEAKITLISKDVIVAEDKPLIIYIPKRFIPNELEYKDYIVDGPIYKMKSSLVFVVKDDKIKVKMVNAVSYDGSDICAVGSIDGPGLGTERYMNAMLHQSASTSFSPYDASFPPYDASFPPYDVWKSNMDERFNMIGTLAPYYDYIAVVVKHAGTIMSSTFSTEKTTARTQPMEEFSTKEKKEPASNFLTTYAGGPTYVTSGGGSSAAVNVGIESLPSYSSGFLQPPRNEPIIFGQLNEFGMPPPPPMVLPAAAAVAPSTPPTTTSSSSSTAETVVNEQYEEIKKMVDEKWPPIQVGIFLCNYVGEMPEFFESSWQINLKLTEGDCKILSDLLGPEMDAIDIQRHRQDGVSYGEFTQMLIKYKLIMTNDYTWITFEGMWHLGYLTKILTGSSLPKQHVKLMEMFRVYFPISFDVRYLLTLCKNLDDGNFESILQHYNLKPKWLNYKAADHASLVGRLFFCLKNDYFEYTTPDSCGGRFYQQSNE